ncbi:MULTISPECIES: DNA polymerase [Paracoccus]|mgnify:CR=1 FL=1|uniref:DNA polymerase n=1 Tax=Paracoccus TaxID=265 RepID=UPI00086D8AC0|nr:MULTISPECIES: DNA polymerase [Paracoccus]ODT60984.1 MAG: hypothetical protein ABS73_03865 [Paracoccus sp. SCN 68-21]
MLETCICDFETYSPVNLPKQGSHVYFESPKAKVLIGSYAIGDGPIQRWQLGEPCPADLKSHIEAGGKIKAFNAGFETRCFEWLAANAGWPMPAYEQFSCTMATGLAMALPQSLDKLGEALDLPIKKDKEGARLMRMFSIPDSKGQVKDPAAHPADFEAYKRYCDLDVAAEREADKLLVPLSDDEQDVWHLSERINRRGLRIDAKSARAAVKLAERAKAKLDEEMAAATGGSVRKVSEIGKLVAWCAAQGVDLPGGAKGDLADALQLTDLPPAVRTALELRLEGGKTSVTKIEAFLNRASPDGRVRGCYTYHGASTGRWTSTGVNVSNLPRTRGIYDDAHLNTATLFGAIRTEDPDVLMTLYGDDLGRPMHLLSDAIRGFILAAPGHEFLQADYSGIEGAVAAWLADEEWKLEAMHGIISDPKIPDMYRQTAARILGLPLETVTKKHWSRQAIGKPAELALGFGGSVSAFGTMARLYRVDLDAMHAPIWEKTDLEMREKAARRFAFSFARGQGGARDMSQNAWMACYVIVQGWRAQNAAIAKAWQDTEGAARAAIESPGTVHDAARCRLISRLGYLWMQLPSKRVLCFPSPQLSAQVWVKVKTEGGDYADAEVMDRDAAEKLAAKGLAQVQGDTSPGISYLGMDRTTNRFVRKRTYGGDLFQSAVQATARDLLVNGMRKAEGAGYPVVLHTYDEMLCEVPRGFGDLAAFERLICELPDWADGLPLTADGWAGKRYRKS